MFIRFCLHENIPALPHKQWPSNVAVRDSKRGGSKNVERKKSGKRRRNIKARKKR